MSGSPEPEESVWQELSAVVAGAEGLHARPAIRLSRAAKGYAARVQIRSEPNSPWVDAKSVAKVIGLQVESGRTIHLRASGSDADAALGGLRRLVEVDLVQPDHDQR